MRRIIKGLKLRSVWTIKTFMFYIFRICPIKKNKVVFTNYYGKGYGDNAKYIAEEIIKQNIRLDLVWLVNDLDYHVPNEIRKVKYDTIASIYEMVTAKVWIDNCRKQIYVRKRKSQFYIQTWHGDIGFKKVEKEAKKSLYNSYIKMAKNDSKMADLFVVGNSWMFNKYRTSFWYKGEIAKCGYPRRDILYQENRQLVEEIRKKIGIKNNEKIVLYAPTFRDVVHDQRTDVYELDWEIILKALSKRFSGDWKVLFRLHPNISALTLDYSMSNNIIDVTDYPDMQELLLVSNVCISDYSSSIFEFSILGKPGFLYTLDYDEYIKNRDLAYSIELTPFSISRSKNELLENILSFDEDEFKKSCDKFYNSYLGMYEEGDASKYLVNRIIKKCN